MLSLLLLIAVGTLLLGVPAALVLAWRGRLGWCGAVLVVMAGASAANYTVQDWYDWKFEEGEATIAALLIGLAGFVITLAAVLLSGLAFALNGRRLRDEREQEGAQ
jgi:uncharacterized membrane protein YeaQ/YmgE (transglycosylase-associated protein family)